MALAPWGKKRGEKSEKGPEWVGEEEEEQFPGISHTTSVAMAIALSVCTSSEQQLHPEPQSQAISIGPFGVWGTSNGHVSSKNR